jgi:hypothetical protein
LQLVDEHFTNSVELVRAKGWQAVVIACLDFMSLMMDALISKVFKRPVLWDHWIKDYHNRDSWQGMEEPFPDTPFVFGLYTNLCTDMLNGVRVITSVMMTITARLQLLPLR